MPISNFFISVVTSVERPVLQNESNDTDDMELDDYNLNDSLEDSLKESNVTEL